LKFPIKKTDFKQKKQNDQYEGSFYFMGTQPIVSPDNFTDQATFKSAVRAEGDLQNPMMSKIFNLINDIDSYL